jgi:hypothetical protein
MVAAFRIKKTITATILAAIREASNHFYENLA